MSKPSRYLQLLLLLPLLLSACAATPPAPEDRHYRLILSNMPPADAMPAIAGVIKVETIKAYGIYRERALLYTREKHPESLQQHRYHYWIDTPTRLIRDQLVDFLLASEVAEEVAGSQVALAGDLHLKLTLKQFERVILETGGTKVRVALDGVVTAADGHLVKRVSYRRELPVEGDSIASSVAAFSQALNDIYFDILADLRER
jgi:ABC-type uncharacterized transport system auxiliary subunit